jgi:cytochrome oxidase Cu insertion factor (SCO1/SenC/PrrC family)
MGLRALTTSGGLLLGLLAGVACPASAPPELFQAMRAMPTVPPVAAPAVGFRDLDGRAVSLNTFRGRPIMLTFFTTW